MNIHELDNAFPSQQFLFNEAHDWIGKKVYVKHLRKMGYVEEMKRMEKGYALLVACDGFSLLLSKPNFAKWIELKPNQVKLPVFH